MEDYTMKIPTLPAFSEFLLYRVFSILANGLKTTGNIGKVGTPKVDIPYSFRYN